MTDRSTAVAVVRERIGPLGVWCTTDPLTSADAAAVARRVEQLGYGAMWLPETVGRDPFTHIAALLHATSTLTFATGIANIHHRHPGMMMQAANTLAEQAPGRFLLALGVSHAPLVAGLRGLDYSKPVTTMRTYLEAMDASPYRAQPPTEAPLRLIGALGPKMVELSGTHADGAHPYWTTPEHTASAREILGPDKLLCVEQKVVLTEDPSAARSTAATAVSAYASLPNYRNNWLRLGFTETEIDERSDRFIDAVVAWGSAAAIADRVRAHLDAGADHVCIQPMTPEHPLRIDDDALVAVRAAVG